MDHMDYLVQRSCEEGGEPCGHALMASCPPDPFPDTRPDVPFGHTAIHTDGVHTQRTWDLSKSDLTLLLDLGRNLYLDGQITPIMAWGIVLAHEKFPDIRDVDFEFLRAELVPKIRCFGYVLSSPSLDPALTEVDGVPCWKSSSCETRSSSCSSPSTCDHVLKGSGKSLLFYTQLIPS